MYNNMEKYLKYKFKYLQLKKQYGGGGGFRVVQNSGIPREGVESGSSQCMFISILDYLQNVPSIDRNNKIQNLTQKNIKDVTVEDLRELVGLNRISNNEFVEDNEDNKDIANRKNIQQLANILNINIKVYSYSSEFVDLLRSKPDGENGTPVEIMSCIPTIATTETTGTINIVSYSGTGRRHFELIIQDMDGSLSNISEHFPNYSTQLFKKNTLTQDIPTQDAIERINSQVETATQKRKTILDKINKRIQKEIQLFETEKKEKEKEKNVLGANKQIQEDVSHNHDRQYTDTLDKNYKMYINMYNELSHNKDIEKLKTNLNEIIELFRKESPLDEDLIEYYELFQHVLEKHSTFKSAFDYISDILNNSNKS